MRETKCCLIFALTFLVSACEFEITEPQAGSGNRITISTSEVTDISQYTAKVGGTLGETYGRIVQDYGHCWDAMPGADLSDNYISSGSANEGLEFSTVLNGLSVNTSYYTRAYFKIDDIVIYGNEITFSTSPPSAPSIETLGIDDTTSTSARCTYNISSDGGSGIIQRGICYSISINPDIENNLHTTINEEGTGTFTEYALGLSANTTYYIRAYAINQVDITYGNEISFNTKE